MNVGGGNKADKATCYICKSLLKGHGVMGRLRMSPIPGPPKTRMSSEDDPPLSEIGMM